MSYTEEFLKETLEILQQLSIKKIDDIVNLLLKVRKKRGRIFFLGIGGGAGHASHAVNDFRKIAGIEAYSPTDNVSELTARINDDGWETSFVNWLKGSKLKKNDALFIFSVGGGDASRNVSINLVRALEYAKSVGSTICGVVGRDGGFTGEVADACVIIPHINKETVTAQTESYQALIWHLIVSHPKLKISEMKWESIGIK